MIKKITDFIKTRYIISGIILLVLVGISYKIFFVQNSTHELFVVDKGVVAQKVVVTGKTKPVDAVDLGFENNGKVAHAYVDVGSRVSVGQTLVALDQSQTYAELLKAQANVATEQANLDQMQKGTRPEEILIAQTGVVNAQTSLSDAQNNMSVSMLDAYTKSDDAIHNSIDQMFSNPLTSNPQFNLTTSDAQTKNSINQNRVLIEGVLNAWKNNTTYTSNDSIVQVKSNLSQIKTFLDTIATIVNGQSGNSNISQSTIDGYKTAVSMARTNISMAQSNISNLEQSLNSAQSALTLTQNTLSLKQAGNTPESIEAQKAKVMQNQAQVQSVEAQLAQETLRSPLNGIVTKQDAKVGEIVTPGKSVVSVISDSNLEIESNVSEISIGKVAVGNPVAITLDAFPGQTFKGTVTYIEPAETVIDGVVNYKVTVTFDEKYPELKSGLTTNLEIMTSSKSDVVRVPQYAIIKKDTGTFVLKSVGGKFVETPVTVGLIGQDGFAEITSGLSVGDSVDVTAGK